MRCFFAAIANALRSSCSFVWDRCARTGAWTLRQVANLVGGGGSPAAPAGEMQQLEAEMADDMLKPIASSAPPERGGDGFDRIQRVCRDLNSDRVPAPEDLAYLSPTTREWLTLLDPSMRLLVGNVEKSALVEHMKGGKGLRGVIRSDAESIAAWKHAVALETLEQEADEYDPPALAI